VLQGTPGLLVHGPAGPGADQTRLL